ncbi:MAG: hypothetical protein ACREPR_04525 [Brasilonema sp.]
MQALTLISTFELPFHCGTGDRCSEAIASINITNPYSRKIGVISDLLTLVNWLI